MQPSFWIKRFFVVLLGIFAMLFVVGLVKGRSLERVVAESAIWAGVSTVIFISARIYHSRRGQHCALCRDTPELAEGSTNSSKTEQSGKL
ncbi:MAG: hypothetical protein K9M98_04060 [Cephaloticoccus sp.]|nr:hypothetical protein [Cephaloticoccus sp.]MCF7759657.1 hypothetical protein [Cephaloticoccus sp.]